MTKMEILNKIKELRMIKQYLAIKDHWTENDFGYDIQLNDQIEYFTKLLENNGGNKC